ncbi:MAG: thiosulfate oxidation carrier protein SoxY [Candidatus Binatia bacterium]
MSRRQFLTGLAGAFSLSLLAVRRASAFPEKLLPLVREVTGGELPKTGKVTLTLPLLAESGNSVPLAVKVASPMTAEDYVTSVHILSPRNPRPVIARFYFSPHSGKAEISTRIRLAGTQQVFAVAVMNDGASWMNSAEVVVTAGACVDEGDE